MPPLVAKQPFLASLACRTQGWYAQHAPPETPTLGLQWRFWVGGDVHDRARAWLGAGTMLRRTPTESAAADTQEAVAAFSDDLLFEATFTWNGLVARADAIRRHGAEWDLIEVKSGKSPDEGDKLKQEYVDDLAYTRMVAGGAGLKISRALLVLINRDYRLDGEAPMFVYVDVTDAVNARAAEFAVIAEDVVRKVAADERPEPEFIFECKDCPYFATDCLGVGVSDPLFIIPRISAKKFDALKVYGRIADIPRDADLTAIQRGIVDVMQAGEPRVNAEGLKVLDQLQWPVRYLDFEAVMPHLPWFAGSAPYETVPFQYSLHVLDAPDAEARHFEFLAETEGDWRLLMTETLLRDLGTSGSIVVYSGYEKGRLKALAQTFPALEGQINAVLERLFDLEQVFKSGYQHPGFAGRTSIKKVLPVMVPELSYKELALNNGDDALGVFGLMRVGAMDSELVPTHRTRLLEYCKLDTWAMVSLHLATAKLR
ncbi:MAG: DUF2779 domain-containing protein [Gemmatimonadaceae bacterium]